MGYKSVICLAGCAYPLHLLGKERILKLKQNFMLSLEECRKYLRRTQITDKELENLRNSLYSMANLVIDHIVSENEENSSNN